jgi:hypothetical protein
MPIDVKVLEIGLSELLSSAVREKRRREEDEQEPTQLSSARAIVMLQEIHDVAVDELRDMVKYGEKVEGRLYEQPMNPLVEEAVLSYAVERMAGPRFELLPLDERPPGTDPNNDRVYLRAAL